MNDNGGWGLQDGKSERGAHPTLDPPNKGREMTESPMPMNIETGCLPGGWWGG